METGVRNPLTNGFFDYNDTATTGTPISLTANVYSKLTNNTLGAFTLRQYAPPGITDIWTGGATNQFNFTQLRLGDQVGFRIDITITTTAPNQTVDLDLFLGIGDPGAYSLNIISERQYKTSGAKKIVAMFEIYMGDATTMNFPAELKIKSDNTATVVVAGWYCPILRPKG